METITMVAVGELKLADDNLRTRPGEIAELAESIKSLGVLEPLLVRKEDKVVVAGARRLMAAKSAGLKVVPAILRSFTEQERLEVMIVENLQREDLTPLEEAEGFKRLSELGHSQSKIAKRVGCSQSHIAKRLGLLELPADVQKQVDKGNLRLEAAQQLAKIKDDPDAVAKIVTAAVRPEAQGIVAMGNPEQARINASSEVTREVDKELRRRERQVKVDKVVAELEKKGEKVIALTSDSYGSSVKTAVRGTKIVHAHSWNENDLVMQVATHKKGPCHAVGVHPVTFEVYEVCTDPKKHKTVAQKNADKKKRAAAENEREEAKKKEAKARRVAFYEQIVRGKVDSKLLVDLLDYHVTVARGLGYETIEQALGLLGIERAVDYPAQMQQYAEAGAKNQTERVRVLVAALMARAGSAYYGDSESWLRFLIELGYEPSKEEQAELDELKAIAEAREKVEAEREGKAQEALDRLKGKREENNGAEKAA